MSTDREASNKLVLVVDDNPVNLKLTAHLIRKAGYLTETAETAELALERLAAKRPDLVVTDLQLPGMDGLAFTRTVKQNSEWQSIPILLLTAAHSPEEEVKARQAGCECSLAKPIDGNVFPSVIQSFLGTPSPVNPRDEELQSLPIEELRKEFLKGGARELRAMLVVAGATQGVAPALDLVHLRKVLHGWAGVGGTLGFPSITAHARGLEAFTSVPDHSPEGLRRKLTDLLHELTHPPPIVQVAGFQVEMAAAIGAGTTDPVKPAILVADDDPTIRAVLRLALENAGFDCRLAHDGVLTCSLARNTLPDAIVLDVNMPRLNGFQVMNCLRGMWKTRNIPVILLTARHDQSAILKGAELGAVDYVTKPFDVDDLVARLQRLIKAR